MCSHPPWGVVGGRANSIDYDSKEVVLQRMILHTRSAFAILLATFVNVLDDYLHLSALLSNYDFGFGCGQN